jgi:hypothetical protein
MAGTTFSDPQEDQAFARIHRLGQLYITNAFKLMLKNSFMQVRLVQRVKKVVPGMIAHMRPSEEIEEIDKPLDVEIKGDCEEELAEDLWKHINGVKDMPDMPEWFKGVLPEKKNKNGKGSRGRGPRGGR